LDSCTQRNFRRGCVCAGAQLTLAYNNIGDSGAVELAKALAVNRALKDVCFCEQAFNADHLLASSAWVLHS